MNGPRIKVWQSLCDYEQSFNCKYNVLYFTLKCRQDSVFKRWIQLLLVWFYRRAVIAKFEMQVKLDLFQN